ncbi:MAG TPA: CsgG/HfaB family protein, partial [Gemmatimonadales bacterium]|nr:CsgG/HfaB family protein [Gemmatimonadales bacterium]
NPGTYPMRRLPRTLPLALAAALLGGCAAGTAGNRVAPDDVPALEAQAQQRPTDGVLLTRLGVAYYGQHNWARARDALKAAVALDASNYRGLVYLGLTYEELGALDSARASYTQARLRARGNRQRAELDDRLTLLTHKEIQQAARTALAQESTLSQTPPEPNTIAVFPFRYLGTDSTMLPLERGIAQLVVADLGKVHSLKLLEREEVQALVDEMRLAESGRVDPATGARSGRLLRAKNVVQGSIQQPTAADVQLDANAINSTDASVSATGSAGGAMDKILDAQKQIVFQLLDKLGVVVTPAERTALEERATRNLQAFLLYSRGLAAQDGGDFNGAANLFGQAARMDPGFRDAGARAAASQSMSAASGTSGDQLAGGDQGSGGNGATRDLADAINPSSGSLTDLHSDPGSTPPGLRPGLPESQGNDNVIPGVLNGTIIIIIPRP